MGYGYGYETDCCYETRCETGGGSGNGSSFVLIIVLFILLIIVGAAIYC